MIHKVTCDVGGKPLTIETGLLAKQADGSVLVSYGDTRVLVTAVSAKKPKEGVDFFPMTVEYAERFYSAGKIPGSFFKREGRPTSEATLSARMIDRPIRPLFPEGYRYDTQIIALILSYDPESDPDCAAAVGASAALHISDIPFNGPTAGVRVGRVNGEYVINPSWETLKSGKSDLEVFVAGTAKAIMMVEGGANQVPEEEVLGAVLTGHREIQKIVKSIEELRSLCGREKREFVAASVEDSVKSAVEKIAKAPLRKALTTKEKLERYALVKEAKEKVLGELVPESLKKSDPAAAEAKEAQVESAFELLQYNTLRSLILDEGSRVDGRDLKTIRPISCIAGYLPRAHGSSLFTRGETQVLGAITLGTSDDEQIVDTLAENGYRKFMLHYNFPPFSVGETGRFGGQSRREIGHGALAERAIKQVMPPHEKFPYTVRIVCETLESNGSSSMGSVCASSMALMDAGVPVAGAVAGIAMGLIKEGSRVAVLSDILGDEDHLGDMDFKVAGTSAGVTAIQMDIKIEGVDEQIMRTALAQAREGRMHILGEMRKAIEVVRDDLSSFAPRITTVQVPKDRIGEVIGPGGKVIKDIIAKTGCKVDINDEGIVSIASSDGEASKKAVQMVNDILAEVEVGQTYRGKVVKIVEFGAFIQVLPNQEGLLHISEIAHERVRVVEDVLKEGDEVEVKVLEVDPRSGKMRLSRKALLEMPEGMTAQPSGGGREGGGGGGGFGGGGGRGRDRGRGGDRGGRDRGDRGGDRGRDGEQRRRPPIKPGLVPHSR